MGKINEDKSDNKNNEKTDLNEIDTDLDSHSYGWFSWNPSWLQWMNNATVFMILMTVQNIFQSGTTNGLMGAAQSSIEKRFQFTSKQSSWIIIAYEIATVPLALFVTYVGTVGCHRPRWTTCFLLVSCVGCFLYALPHFTTPVYLPGGGDEKEDYLCSKNRTVEDKCNEDEENSSIQAYMAVFILARIGLAFGGTGLYNFAVTYLDDSLTRDKFSLYTSMLALGGVVGPALGFILGGYLLSIYTDFPSVDDEDLGFDQNDPRWVGAWWLGYVIAGFGLIITTLPMSGYPRDLPGAEEMRKKKVNEASGTTDDPSLTTLKFDFKKEHIKQFSKDLFTNWSFDFLSLYVCCDMAIISGFTVFGPKYAEVQFSLTAGEAGVLFGLLVVPAGAIGAISGGLVIERLKMTFNSIVKTEFFISIVVFFMAFPIFLTYCDQVEFAGVNVKYPNSTNTEIDIMDPCNANCSCDGLTFNPVCHSEVIQYFSPCHAGCQTMNETLDSKHYYNCACITPSGGPDAVGGICHSSNCGQQLAIFCVVLFIAMVGLFMSEAMNISSVIRVVPNSHRLFAMMVEGFIVRFLGTMPGPMIFGAAFDISCLLWQSNCNGENGSCYNYDNSYLGYFMLVTAGGIKLLSCVFMFLAWKLYKPPENPDEEILTVTNEKDVNELNNDSYKDGIVTNGIGNGTVNVYSQDVPIETWVKDGITMTAL